MTKLITLEELHRRSIVSRQKKAAARRAQVKALKANGMTAPQIATQLGIKVRTVYHDFSILKREVSESKNR